MSVEWHRYASSPLGLGGVEGSQSLLGNRQHLWEREPPKLLAAHARGGDSLAASVWSWAWRVGHGVSMGNRRKGGWERVGFSPYTLPVPGMKRTHQEGVLKNGA